MALSLPHTKRTSSRRTFLKAGLLGAAGLALYSGEVERHWIDVVERDVTLSGLSSEIEGMRIVQISDIHMNDFTESFFLRDVVERINQLKPDVVFLTGDFVTTGKPPNTKAHEAAWQCARILEGLDCRQVYAILGNHDVNSGARVVYDALNKSGIIVLRNAYLPIERGKGRFWLAGLDDAMVGHPNLDLAIPEKIRNVRNEPVILMCHEPDYATNVQAHPAGQAVDFMISGHTHGGQVRLPFIGALVLPPLGRLFVEGLFELGSMKLYVNRGIGTIQVPFRLDCPPEITLFTLRAT
jgi:predicted MPP superfamily phosphohydrolase